MIAFYAMGGGWGHLTRIKTFIQNKDLHVPFKVITANLDVERFFDPSSALYIAADEHCTVEGLSAELKAKLEPWSFQECYVDVFPCGILGELTRELFPAATFHYLGRRLRWKHYQPQLSSVLEFESSFLLEELEPAHLQFIQRHSQQVMHHSLHYPAADPSFSHPLLAGESPIWLIVHTSNKEEINLLLNHARDVAAIEGVQARFVILSNEQIADGEIPCLTDQNPTDWYPKVGKIVTAAGFNSWHQLVGYRAKHVCLPLPRKFDDQFWRSRQH